MEVPEHIITCISTALASLTREREEISMRGGSNEVDLPIEGPEVEQIRRIIDGSKQESHSFEKHLLWIFQALDNAENCTPTRGRTVAELRFNVIMHVLKTVTRDTPCPEDISHAAISRLLAAVQHICPRHIAAVISETLDIFDNWENSSAAMSVSLLKLLPNGLAKADGAEEGQNMYEDDAMCSSSDLQETIVCRLLQKSWPRGNIAELLELLRDLKLKPLHKQSLIEKAFQECSKAELVDLPAAIHQLLLLSDKNTHSTVLLGLLKLYNKRTKQAAQSPHTARIAAEIGGTLLLEIELMTKHHLHIGKAWVATLQALDTYCTFSVAVMLTLASIQPFADAATSALKKLVLAAYLTDERRSTSSWVASLTYLPCPDGESLEAALLTCIKNASQGWDRVMMPGLELATALVDCPPRQGAGSSPRGPNERATRFGRRMALNIFKSSPPARAEVLDVIQARLIGNRTDSAASYLPLLKSLIDNCPAHMCEHASRLKVYLDCFPLMAPQVALGVLKALAPIFTVRADIKDATILSLRKAMFARDVTSRLLAVRGFLFMILCELSHSSESSAYAMEPSSSQASMSQLSALTSGSGGLTLLQELTGFLRRCLSQQAVVREALYKGISKLLAVDPMAKEAMADLLLPHLQQFIDDGIPPLKLESCAYLQGEEPHLVEPLHLLLACVRDVIASDTNSQPCDHGSYIHAHRFGTYSSGSGRPIMALRECFETICSRMLESHLEDFGLDGLTEFSAALPQGLLNQMTAGVLLGSIEVFMEDLVEQARRERTEMSGSQINKLFALHDRLFELVGVSQAKKVSSALGTTQITGQKRTRPGLQGAQSAVPQPSSTLIDKRTPAFSNQCLVRLLDAVVDDGVVPVSQLMQVESQGEEAQSTLPSHTKLARDARFQAFVLRSTLRVMHRSACQGHHDAMSCDSEADNLEGSIALGHALIRSVQIIVLACSDEQPSRHAVGTRGKKDKNPRDILRPLAVHCLHSLLSAVRSREVLSALIKGVGPALPESTPLQTIPIPEGTEPDTKEVLDRLPHLNALLQRLLRSNSFHEVELMAESLQHVGKLLPLTNRRILCDWGLSACSVGSGDDMVKHGKAVRALVQLCLDFAGSSDVEVLQNLLTEVEPLLAASEDDVGPSEKWPLINSKSAISVATSVISYLESCLLEVDWMLSMLKIFRTPGQSGHSQRVDLEDRTFVRLQGLIQGIGPLLGPCLAYSTHSDNVLRVLVQVYRSMTLASLLVTAPKGYTQAIPSRAFQQLVGEVNKELTGRVYDFVLPSRVPDENQPSNAQSSKGARRENKTVPALVFAIEEFERHLIVLSRNSKINLMRMAKKSQARDFKITIPGLQRVHRLMPQELPAPPPVRAMETTSNNDASGGLEAYQDGSDAEDERERSGDDDTVDVQMAGDE
eukprot:jgi/Botrbrau1/5768/Bobra.0134s0035.2